jgi:hypothetical protein
MRRRLVLIVLSAAALVATSVFGSAPAFAQDDGAPAEQPAAEDEPKAEEKPQAKAKKVSGETLALAAARVQSEHCADAYGVDTTRALRSIATVGEVWAQLSEQYERSHETYLLYWRGVLAQCMDQEVRGLDDLKGFVTRAGSSTLWIDLVKDANRRIRQLERRAKGGVDPRAVRKPLGLVVGGSLAVVSAVTAINAASLWNRSQETSDLLKTAEYATREGESPATFRNQFEDGRQRAQESQISSAVSVATGIGSIVSFVVAATGGRAGGIAAGSALLLPTAGGAAVLWEGQW